MEDHASIVSYSENFAVTKAAAIATNAEVNDKKRNLLDSPTAFIS
jgi:hypothetical protein